MARRIPENRFAELVAAATDVFIARGYRRTQMSDVAEAVGVAKGTLYGYVESKDALLALCLLHADPSVPMAQPAELPVATWPKGRIAEVLKQATNSQSMGVALASALELERAAEPRAEFDAVVREFYDTLYRNRWAIKLIEKCTDHPEVRNVWQSEGREAPRFTWARYLESRIAAGQVRTFPDVALAARMIIEVCTTWAVHIHWDPMPQRFDSDIARETAISLLVRSYVIDAGN